MPACQNRRLRNEPTPGRTQESAGTWVPAQDYDRARGGVYWQK